MTKHTRKKLKNDKNKTRKEMIVWKGGAWYSYFLPLFGYKSGEDVKKPLDQNAKKPGDSDAKKSVDPDSNVTDTETDSNVTDKDDSLERKPEPVNNGVKGKKAEKGKKDKAVKGDKNMRELYKVEKDEARIDKEFYDNPNITTWCFDDPEYKPVGMVHVTSVVGINILRTYATTVRNIVGVKGTIDENMHRLRNEIYNEMENVMEAKNIDKICAVGVAFTKDSGSLILSAFGTALRKQVAE